MSDRGAVTITVPLVVAAGAAWVTEQVEPGWVPDWAPGATVLLALVAAAWRAAPAVRSAWRGLRRLGEVVDSVIHLAERLAVIEHGLGDGAERVRRVEIQLAGVKAELQILNALHEREATP